MAHNFNKEIKTCRTCGHFNHNMGTFSYCLIQEDEVWEGDHCDRHATPAEAKKWVDKEYMYQGTIFDRGDGKANF